MSTGCGGSGQPKVDKCGQEQVGGGYPKVDVRLGKKLHYIFQNLLRQSAGISFY